MKPHIKLVLFLTLAIFASCSENLSPDEIAYTAATNIIKSDSRYKNAVFDSKQSSFEYYAEDFGFYSFWGSFVSDNHTYTYNLDIQQKDFLKLSKKPKEWTILYFRTINQDNGEDHIIKLPGAIPPYILRLSGMACERVEYDERIVRYATPERISENQIREAQRILGDSRLIYFCFPNQTGRSQEYSSTAEKMIFMNIDHGGDGFKAMAQ